MKAYRGWVPDLGGTPDDDEHCGLYRAASRDVARYMCFLHAADSFDNVRFTDPRVRRAPEFDDVPFTDGTAVRYAR